MQSSISKNTLDYSAIDQSILQEAMLHKALAHPIRLKIISLLTYSEGLTHHQLTRELKILETTVSRNLRILEKAQLVTSYRRGKHFFYSLSKAQ